MRRLAPIALCLVLLTSASACEAEPADTSSEIVNVFPPGTVFTDAGIVLPDGHVCVGVEPPESAYAASPGPVIESTSDRPDVEEGDAEARTPREPDMVEDPCVVSPGTCVGGAPPQWALADFQPQSCGSGAVYGLDVFKGRPTVAILLAAW